MLDKTAVELGVNLASIIKSTTGATLRPKSSTLAELLFSSVYNNLSGIDFKSGNLNKDEAASLIYEASCGVRAQDEYKRSAHDVVFDNYVEDMAKYFGAYVSYARNVVKAQALEFYEKLKGSVDTCKSKSAYDLFNIEFYSLSDVFSNEWLHSELSSYNTESKVAPELLNVEKLQDFDFFSYILVADEDFNSDLNKWSEYLKSKGLCVGKLLKNNTKEVLMRLDEKLDYYLANFLFYKNLSARADLALAPSTVALRAAAKASADYFAVNLKLAIAEYNKKVANQVVLLNNSDIKFSYMTEGVFDIYVIKDSFDRACEEGATIDALLGKISSSPSVNFTAKDLIEEKDTLVKKWTNISYLYSNANRDFALTRSKLLISSMFDEYIANLSEEEIEHHGSSVENFKKQALEQAKEYIDSLVYDDIDKLDEVCLYLIANIKFKHTNSYKLIKEIDSLLKNSDTMTVQQAVAYSCLYYITDYMCSQLEKM